LFDQVVSSSVSSENKIFFGKLAKQKNSQSLVCKAAFDLLQWAQYDCGSHAFDKRNQVDSSSNDIESDDEQQEEKLLDEEEVNRPHSVQESQDFGLDLKSNSNEYHEAEPPEEFRCQLRPYQKKALWWMMQRERVEENEQAIRQQLQVLRDLVSSNTKQSETLTSNSDISSIQCECGPVLVNLQECQAPPITDNGTCAHLSHPLWERRFLCSGDQKRALSFYIQPLFGLAVASPPIPPQTCRGGILADSMGLGKTVMLLALIQKSKQEEGKGTTLIVAPLSLLAQWEEELQSKTNLSCQVYYGGDKKVCANIDAFDVILTTYGTLQSEVQWQSKKQKTSDVSEKRFKGGLLGHSWKRAILDEAHVVKNTATVASRACCSLEAERRWCVSGTIIQNSLDDVYSLIKFLGHEPWNSRAFWNTAVTKEENTEIALSRVRQVLTPILMRRTKDSVDETGNPILSLPVMETKTIRVEFSAEERHFYDALFRKSLTLFEGFLRQGTASKSWLAIFSLLHRLRQVSLSLSFYIYLSLFLCLIFSK
jgi:SNF2 family DNA or RNA helicase